MAITLFDDIVSIIKILRQDPYLESLGFSDKNIYSYEKKDEELDENVKYIFIEAPPPGAKGKDDVYAPVLYSITISGNRNEWGDVLNAMGQVQALLQYKDIGNNHALDLYDPPAKVSSPKNMIMYICTYKTYATVINDIKTV